VHKYELVYLLNPNTSEEKQKEIVDRLKGYIEQMGGIVDRFELWEKRRLAYPIKKFNEAFYYILNFQGYGKIVEELERRLRVTDEVIRFLTINRDRELKVLEKMKAYRKKKAEIIERKKMQREEKREFQRSTNEANRTNEEEVKNNE